MHPLQLTSHRLSEFPSVSERVTRLHAADRTGCDECTATTAINDRSNRVRRSTHLTRSRSRTRNERGRLVFDRRVTLWRLVATVALVGVFGVFGVAVQTSAHFSSGRLVLL